MLKNVMVTGTRCVTKHFQSYFVIDTTAFKLKNEFLAVQHLQGMSGWSWDDARHKVTAPDDVWDAHITVCSLSVIFYTL